jgi:hypothetical protein
MEDWLIDMGRVTKETTLPSEEEYYNTHFPVDFEEWEEQQALLKWEQMEKEFGELFEQRKREGVL